MYFASAGAARWLLRRAGSGLGNLRLGGLGGHARDSSAPSRERMELPSSYTYQASAVPNSQVS